VNFERRTTKEAVLAKKAWFINMHREWFAKNKVRYQQVLVKPGPKWEFLNLLVKDAPSIQGR
jgi:hypothetical protein